MSRGILQTFMKWTQRTPRLGTRICLQHSVIHKPTTLNAVRSGCQQNSALKHICVTDDYEIKINKNKISLYFLFYQKLGARKCKVTLK